MFTWFQGWCQCRIVGFGSVQGCGVAASPNAPSMQKTKPVQMSVTQLVQDSVLQVLRQCCGKRDQPKPSSFLPSRHAPSAPPSPFPSLPPAGHPTSTCFPLAQAKEHGLKDSTCLKISGTRCFYAFLSRVGLTDSTLFRLNSLSICCSTADGRMVAEKDAAATLLHDKIKLQLANLTWSVGTAVHGDICTNDDGHRVCRV